MEVLKLKYVRRLRRYHITSGSIILPEVLPYLRTSVRRFSIFEGTLKVLSYFRTSVRVVVHVRRYSKLLLPYDDKCLFICVVLSESMYEGTLYYSTRTRTVSHLLPSKIVQLTCWLFFELRTVRCRGLRQTTL